MVLGSACFNVGYRQLFVGESQLWFDTQNICEGRIKLRHKCTNIPHMLTLSLTLL